MKKIKADRAAVQGTPQRLPIRGQLEAVPVFDNTYFTFFFKIQKNAFKRRKRCQSFRMITLLKSIKSLAYTVRSKTTNNYIYIQHHIKLLIKLWF